MNLQALFQIANRDGDWATYCREPVKSQAEAQTMLNQFNRRMECPTRVVLQDWDDLRTEDPILYPVKRP